MFDLQALTKLVLDAALGRPLPKLHPPATIAALRTLAGSGIEPAVARWDSLKSASPGGYDFSPDYMLFIGKSFLNTGSSREAELFAGLFGRIMFAGVVAEVAADLRTFLKENPGNENAKIMLGILAGEG